MNKQPRFKLAKRPLLLALACLSTAPAGAATSYVDFIEMNGPGTYTLNGRTVFTPYLGTELNRTKGDLINGTLNFCRTNVLWQRCDRSFGEGYLQSGTIAVNMVNAETFFIGGNSQGTVFLQGAISTNNGGPRLRLEIGGGHTGAAGLVKINSNQVFSELHVQNGRLDLNGAGVISANNMRLNAVTGQLLNQSGNASFAGGVSLETVGRPGGLVNIGGDGGLTLGGVVSGDAGLNKLGAGTLQLNGDNSYSGDTLVGGGTLVQRGDSKSSNFSMAAGATLDLAVASGLRSYSADARFSGDGMLRKSGDGTAAWEGSKATFAMSQGSLIDVQGGSFVGGSYNNEDWSQNRARLNVAAGAVFWGVEAQVRVDALSGAGTIGTGYGQNHGSVTFGVANGSGHFSGTLRDTDPDGVNWGGFVKEGSGTQILTGDTSLYGFMRINGGTLQIGDGGTSGTLSATILNNAQLSFKRADNVRFDSVLRGSGSFSQLGSGTLTVANALEYSGNTTVDRGTLALDGYGRLPEATTVYISNGGTLDLKGRVQTVQGLGSAAQPVAGEIRSGRLISARNSFYIKSGTVSAALDGAHADARLWIGGDANATVLLNGSNDMVYTPDHHQLIIGHGVTGAAGVVKVGNANALAAASEEVQVFAGTLDLNGVAGVRAASIQLLGGGASSLINGKAGSIAKFSGSVGLSFQQASSIGGAGDLWLLGDVTGEGGGLTKIGGGMLVLSGNNSHSGATMIEAGTLTTGRSSSLSAASTIYINNGATLQLGGSSQRVSGLGDAQRPIAGNMTVGRLEVGSGAAFIKSGNIAATLAGNHANARLWIGGDANATLLLNGNNEMVYTPDHNQVIIGHPATGAAGVVKLGNAMALAAASENVQLFAGTLDLNGISQVRANSIALLDSAGLGNALVNGRAGSMASFAGALLVEGSAPALGGDGHLTLSGPLSGHGQPLQKIGAGTLTLTGANSYAGGMVVRQGVLAVSSAQQLGSGPLSLNGGTLSNVNGPINIAKTITLDSAGGSFAPGAPLTLSGHIGGSGALSLDGGGVLVLSGPLTYSGSTHVIRGELRFADRATPAGRLDIDGSGRAYFTGTHSVAGSIGGHGSLFIDAGASVLLSGNNDGHDGATLVQRGAQLSVKGSNTQSFFSVQQGGEINGTGTLGSLTLAGLVSPGAPAAIGSLDIKGNASFARGAGYRWELSDLHGHDSLKIGGSLSLDASANAPFTISLVSLLPQGNAFDARHDHSYTLAYAEGGILGFSGDEFRIDASGFGNFALHGGQWSVAAHGKALELQFTAAAVPEPQSWALMLAGLMGLAGLRRQRGARPAG